ncbi:hypothetical protein LCGC14_0443680 [marine sediment metagenome]|uniref:Uncharacterized protein n=1 Tax=marine sediment metagenome TaxID=412755 RepID=A0A0F9T2X0_9ZZZZ
MATPREDAKTEARTVDTRRRQVARLFAAGYSTAEMVATLTDAGYRRVSRPTIQRDVDALRRKWTEENADASAQWEGFVQRLDEEIEFWRRQVLLAPTVEQSAKIYADVVLVALKERAKLSGSYLPPKIDIGGFVRNWALGEGYDPDRAVELGRQVVDSLGF